MADALNKPFDQLYGYDGLSRLKTWSQGTLNANKDGLTTQAFGQCWSLDETGNWNQFKEDVSGNGTWNLEQTRTANKVNEITDINETTGPSWVTPAYDANGNMTTIPNPSRPALNWQEFSTSEWGTFTHDQWSLFQTEPPPTAPASYTATWDAWNRLVRLTDPDTSNTAAEYEYDEDHRRVTNITFTSGSLDQTLHYYLSHQWQTLEERVDSSTDAQSQYIWGSRYIDDCTLRDRDTNANGTLNERLYALQDANWNVTTLVDNSGEAQERFAYTPYGESNTLTPNFTTTTDEYNWTYRFTGRELDLNTLLYYFRNRYLSSFCGVFTTRDSLEFTDGMSLYANYFSPRFQDPLGLAVLVPYNPNTYFQEKFDNWAKTQVKKGSWWESLPQCPSNICFTVHPVSNNSLTPAYNNPTLPPGVDSSKWNKPAEIGFHEGRFHPGATYSMRSKNVGKSTNQCTYDSSGKLIRSASGKGTVDFRAGGNPFSGHISADVSPIYWAAVLDGCWKSGSRGWGTFGEIMASGKCPGSNMKKYFELRPLWAEDVDVQRPCNCETATA